MARYSLLLVGGPEANRVTARLAAKAASPDLGRTGSPSTARRFRCKDAAVQMIYPNPLNAERYVWIAAGTSTDGMYFCDIEPSSALTTGTTSSRTGTSPPTSRLPPRCRRASSRGCSTTTGASATRWPSRATPRSGPRGGCATVRTPKLVVDPKLLESYVGRYQIAQGPLVEVIKDGKRLMAKQQGRERCHGARARNRDELLHPADTTSGSASSGTPRAR